MSQTPLDYSSSNYAAAAAAVYSQLDVHNGFNYAPSYQSTGSQHDSHGHVYQGKSTSSQRHNPYSRSSTSSNTTGNNSESLLSNESSSVNATAAAIWSTLGANQSVANSYSAALYYHPYYTAHHYLHHPNAATNHYVDSNVNLQK